MIGENFTYADIVVVTSMKSIKNNKCGSLSDKDYAKVYGQDFLDICKALQGYGEEIAKDYLK